MVANSVPSWYNTVVDINVKNLDPEIAERLAAQAAAEGMSQQEWIRQTLRRSASRLSPAELLAQRSELQAMRESEFAKLRRQVNSRRRRTVEQLSASQRRR
jgi:plasmid stability protein